MYITLPTELKAAIDIAVSQVAGNQSIMRNNAYHFFHQAITDSIRYKGLPCDYVQYDHERLRKMLGRNKRELVDSFKRNHMIAVDETAVTGLKAYGYQVYCTYLGSMDYETFYIPKISSESAHKTTEEILRQCTIDVNQAQSEILRYVTSGDYLADIQCNEEIIREYLPEVKVYSTITKQFSARTNIRRDLFLDKFYTVGFSLIKQGKKYFYMPLDMYMPLRKYRILFSYQDAVGRFNAGDIWSNRDEKGHRLHSNITNIPSRLCRYLTYQGQYFIEIDLGCAQWVFLVYCLENQHLNNLISNGTKEYGFKLNSPAYRIFKDLVCQGILYDWIQSKLNLTSRQAAKDMIFEILFGNRRLTESKKRLRELFPEIVDFLEWLKSKVSYRQIPITLQQIESGIIVDTILKILHEEGLPVLTKHDSFLIPTLYYQLSKEIIVDNLNCILGKDNYKLKTTHLSP
jgi:hypothetical protein